MVEFIFTLVLMVSLSFVLYLMVIALPRVAEDSGAETRQSFLDRWARSHVPEKIDAAFNSFFLKLLRRAKVLVLKLDNALGKHLKNMKVEDDAKKPIDFSDLTEEKDGSEENIKN
jgi:hypothetical protein